MNHTKQTNANFAVKKWHTKLWNFYQYYAGAVVMQYDVKKEQFVQKMHYSIFDNGSVMQVKVYYFLITEYCTNLCSCLLSKEGYLKTLYTA